MDGVAFVGEDTGYPPGMVQMTRVRVQPDGSQKVTTKLITPEQKATMLARRAELQAMPEDERTADVLNEDSSCASTDILLENSASAAHCPAIICFANTGSQPDYAYLHNYAAPIYGFIEFEYRCSNALTWAGNVSFYFAGNEEGCLSSTQNQVYSTSAAQDYINFKSGTELLLSNTQTGWADYLWLAPSGTDTGGKCIACNTSGGYTTNCNDACVDTNTDLNNCGACGNACATGASCLAGTPYTCQCPPAFPTVCDGECVNTETSGTNCGYCGHNVGTDGECVGGTVCGGPNAPCSIGGGCCTNEYCMMDVYNPMATGCCLAGWQLVHGTCCNPAVTMCT
jgi:hypothetical protein